MLSVRLCIGHKAKVGSLVPPGESADRGGAVPRRARQGIQPARTGSNISLLTIYLTTWFLVYGPGR